MKTLLVITSIILISFQLEYIFVDNLADPSDAISTWIEYAPVKKTLPEAKNLGSNMALLTEKTAPLTAETPKIATEYKKNGRRLKAKVNTSLEQINTRNAQRHNQVKLSGNYVELESLQFAFADSQNIDIQEFNSILHFADQLIFDQSLKISIAGFTDNIGTAVCNKALSLSRAQHVKQYLIDLGVNEKQIITSANGFLYPVADNATEEGRTSNRRVELLLLQ